MSEIVVTEEEPGRWVVTGCGQYQPFDPDQTGFVPMSKERAEEVAAGFRAALEETIE